MSGEQKRQYTLRNVPASVDRALRRRAKVLGRSLNEVATEALARGIGVSGEAIVHRDLDALIGTWVEDEATERALVEQRQIDPDLWR